jgi:hypothetical protein
VVNYLDGIASASANRLLLDLYRRVTVPPPAVSEMQDCFALAKRKLLEEAEAKVSATSPTPTVDDIRILGDLASKGLSARELGADLQTMTESVMTALSRRGMDRAFEVPVAEAIANILQADIQNVLLTGRDSVYRIATLHNLNSFAYRTYNMHRQSLPENVLTVLTNSLPDLVKHRHYQSEAVRLENASNYIRLLDAIARTEPIRKPEIRKLLQQFAASVGSEVARLDAKNQTVLKEMRELQSYLRT